MYCECKLKIQLFVTHNIPLSYNITYVYNNILIDIMFYFTYILINNPSNILCIYRI